MRLIVIDIRQSGNLSGSSADSLSPHDWCEVRRLFEEDKKLNLNDYASEYDDGKTHVLWNDYRYVGAA